MAETIKNDKYYTIKLVCMNCFNKWEVPIPRKKLLNEDHTGCYYDEVGEGRTYIECPNCLTQEKVIKDKVEL
jgi:hypothetical protein